MEGWALKWRSENILDGKRERLMMFGYPRPYPEIAVFHTRQEARDFLKKNYSYIGKRPDLKAEPHGWKVPQVVKVKLALTEI